MFHHPHRRWSMIIQCRQFLPPPQFIFQTPNSYSGALVQTKSSSQPAGISYCYVPMDRPSTTVRATDGIGIRCVGQIDRTCMRTGGEKNQGTRVRVKKIQQKPQLFYMHLHVIDSFYKWPYDNKCGETLEMREILMLAEDDQCSYTYLLTDNAQLSFLAKKIVSGYGWEWFWIFWNCLPSKHCY